MLKLTPDRIAAAAAEIAELSAGQCGDGEEVAYDLTHSLRHLSAEEILNVDGEGFEVTAADIQALSSALRSLGVKVY